MNKDHFPFIGITCIAIIAIIFFTFSFLPMKRSPVYLKKDNNTHLSPTVYAIKNHPADTINIGTVRVKNFYGKEKINVTATKYLHNDRDYYVLYIPNENLFFINLLTDDVISVRHNAENKLLSMLGIDKIKACLLKVQITASRTFNTEYAGKSFGLSFCK
jgi:hypothetical protein